MQESELQQYEPVSVRAKRKYLYSGFRKERKLYVVVVYHVNIVAFDLW